MASALGMWLREQMRKRELDQMAFAKLCKVGPSQMSNLLNDPELKPKYGTLIKISEGLKVDLGELFTLIGYPITRDKRLGKAEQVAIILEDVPAMAGFFDDLLMLRPDQLETMHHFARVMIGQTTSGEGSEG